MKSLSVELATHPTFMFKKFPEAISIHNNSLGLPWCSGGYVFLCSLYVIMASEKEAEEMYFWKEMG